jgi:hypothetical protein
MKELFNVRYLMDMLSIGGDLWRLSGNLESEKPDYRTLRYTSTPIEFDDTTNILKTASGSRYHLNFIEECKEKTIAQIKKDIQP